MNMLMMFSLRVRPIPSCSRMSISSPTAAASRALSRTVVRPCPIRTSRVLAPICELATRISLAVPELKVVKPSPKSSALSTRRSSGEMSCTPFMPLVAKKLSRRSVTSSIERSLPDLSRRLSTVAWYLGSEASCSPAALSSTKD